MFKWEKESHPESDYYFLRSDEFEQSVAIIYHHHCSEKWTIKCGSETEEVSGNIETVQRFANHLAILHLTTAIQEISSLSI